LRILSARITRALLNRATARVEAVIALTAATGADDATETVRISVSAPARADGAAPLRDRLIAAAKLTYATTPRPARNTARYQRHAA
jgi:hypothetical protein